MGAILELAIAALYLIGAAFNATYTLRNSDSFYGRFAEGALLPPAEALIRRIVTPNGRAFTIALIAFQLAVAVLIIARGGLAFCLLRGAYWRTAENGRPISHTAQRSSAHERATKTTGGDPQVASRPRR